MEQKDYEANLETAVSYLKMDLKTDAEATFKMAMSQVPQEDKTSNNIAYIRILCYCAWLSLEAGDIIRASNLINEGLKLRKMHADLLFLNSLIFRSAHKYGDMLTSLISYLIAADLPDKDLFSYEFVNPGVLKSVIEDYIPLAFRNTPNHAPILEVIKNTIVKIKELASGEYIERAYNILIAIEKENMN
ncbi:hypothetical protein MCHI_001539 [Candidatus Magnetoovum chiemensis]|nr:hypothetical protein MCHI_001539 [Candidatus Magnetoovum chiemensis]